MIGFKLALLLAVLAAGYAGGALALRRGGGAGETRRLALGNAFAAGVFLGAGLIHLLPAAATGWAELGFAYPMAYLLATVAFVAMLLFEHVLIPEHEHHGVHEPSGHSFDPLGDAAGAGWAAYVVLAALSVHSLLAGLALGAAGSVSGALVIFVAILAHKSSAGFALGVSLVRSSIERRRRWALLSFFAFSTPLGIGLGALMNVALEGRAQHVAEASFLALAAGTFVYVATFDILRDEFLEPAGRGAKWWLVTAGAALMGAVAIVI